MTEASEVPSPDTPCTTTGSYLVPWHRDVFSLEALWVSRQHRLMTSEQPLPFTNSRLLSLQLPPGHR